MPTRKSELKSVSGDLVWALPFVPNENLEHVIQYLEFPTYKMSPPLPTLPTSQDVIFKDVGLNMFHKLKKASPL